MRAQGGDSWTARLARAATLPRLGGAVAAVLANLAALAFLALSEGPQRAGAGQSPSTVIYFLPPPVEPPPEPTPREPVRMAATVPRPPIVAAPPGTKRPEEESNAITLPPQPQIPLGLRSLIDKDPCRDPRERLRRRDCPAEVPGAGSDALMAAVEDARRTELAEFGPQCMQLHGCLPVPTKTLNGLNPIAPKSPMSSGAAGLGGINDLVGRLPPPNWYHVDPGFGD